jgi:hypothetical protein
MPTHDLPPTACVSTGSPPVKAPAPRPTAGAVERNRFASQSLDRSAEAYAVFSVDPNSRQLRVMVVDAEGRALQSAPPPSAVPVME